MLSRYRLSVSIALLLGCESLAAAQTFEVVGTRAAGMGGAFVAVADDASAVYWNPGGLALGNMFTLVVDNTLTRVEAKNLNQGSRDGSGFLLALGMPALGLAYYRLEANSVKPSSLPTASPADDRQTPVRLVELDSLTTQNLGATFVQSLAPGIAVGTTLRYVHGLAATTVFPDGNRDALLDAASELQSTSTDKFDTDLGVMAGSGHIKMGFTMRNLFEPSFNVQGSSVPLTLERQARAGVAVTPVEGWAVSADFDITSNPSPEGDVRSMAVGTEGRLGPKVMVRSGFRLSTTGSARPSVAAGGSYKVGGVFLIDAQATWGSDAATRGWGISGRLVY
jgi:hypothetical protein